MTTAPVQAILVGYFKGRYMHGAAYRDQCMQWSSLLITLMIAYLDCCESGLIGATAAVVVPPHNIDDSLLGLLWVGVDRSYCRSGRPSS